MKRNFCIFFCFFFIWFLFDSAEPSKCETMNNQHLFIWNLRSNSNQIRSIFLRFWFVCFYRWTHFFAWGRIFQGNIFNIPEKISLSISRSKVHLQSHQKITWNLNAISSNIYLFTCWQTRPHLFRNEKHEKRRNSVLVACDLTSSFGSRVKIQHLIQLPS